MDNPFRGYTLPVVKNALKSMILPAVGGGIWTLIKVRASASPTTWDVKLGFFVAGFFFAAWFANAFFRSEKKHSDDLRFEKIISAVTGGDAFPIVRLSHQLLRQPNNEYVEAIAGLWAHVHGMYSVYDLALSVTDLDRLEQLMRTRSGDSLSMADYMSKHELGTIGRGYDIRLPVIVPSTAEKLTFQINGVARNGITTQKLLGRKVGGQWYSALRVKFLPSGHGSIEERVVLEQIDPGFPADELTDLNFG